MSNAEEAWASRTPPSAIQTTVSGLQGAISVGVYLAYRLVIGTACSVDILNRNRQAWNEEPTSPTDVMFRDGGDPVGA